MRLHQIEGDVFHALPRLPAASFHGCVSDLPYLIDFMGRDFDRQHRQREGTEAERAFAWNLDVCRELYRLLVPGALAMIFQGSRTYHRLAYAAEVAGFEVLPMICGIVGSAMAQGGNVGRLIDREAGAEREVVGSKSGLFGTRAAAYASDVWTRSRPRGAVDITAPATPLARDFDGHGTRIRDQLLPVAVLMKPVEGSFATNAARWGVAGFDVDGSRVETTEDCARTGDPRDAALYGAQRKAGGGHRLGRFPGNVLLDDDAAEEVGEMSGERPGRPARAAVDGSGSGGNGRRGIYRNGWAMKAVTGYNDKETTAARYFRRFAYVGRAPKLERVRGLESWHWIGDEDHPEGWRRLSTAEAIEVARDDPARLMTGSNHPTLKALELCRWVARLILPPMGPEAAAIRERTTGSPGRLLAPFSGVLSEVIGAALAGWPEVVAVEYSPSYVAQGGPRFAAWGPYCAQRADAVEAAGGLTKTDAHHGQADLFADMVGSPP